MNDRRVNNKNMSIKNMDNKMEILLKGTIFSHMIKDYLSDVMKEHNLKRADMEVLYFLSVFPDNNTPSEVAKYTQLTRGHVSQAVDSLLKQGYITGEQDTHDRRSVHYHITEKAVPVAEEITDGRKELEARLFAGISDEDRASLERITGLLLLNIDRIIAEQGE